MRSWSSRRAPTACRLPLAYPGHQPQPQRQAEPHPLPVTPFGNLAGAIAAVMAEIKPVEKGGWNKFQSYSYAAFRT